MHQAMLIEWRPGVARYGVVVPEHEHEDEATTDVAMARLTAATRTSRLERMELSRGGLLAALQMIIGVAALVLFVSIVCRIIW